MTSSEHPFAVSEMSTDARVRVFRRIFSAPGKFENMQVDAYVVVTTRYVVVLDTLLCPEDMAAVMYEVRDELADRQLLVVDSHADWDHCWGNNYFTGEHAAPILAHEYCLTRMQSEEARVRLADYQARYPLFRNVVLTTPTITFPRTLTIHGGDLTIQLLPAPGHHPDHIAAWLPELSLLLTFDAVEKPLPILENAAGVQPMYETLKRFLAMQPQRVLCSHGKTTSVDTVKQNLTYLQEIERRGRALLTTHRPSNAELEQAPALIHYRLDDVLAGASDPVDHAFYTWAHENNVRCILRWLMEGAD